MARIRITRKFNFEMAHALWNYKGACKGIHGHSYKLFVTVTGIPESDNTSAKYGMVMDFGDLKKIVEENVINVFDHTVLLYSEASTCFESMGKLLENKIIIPYQPTCENMVTDFAARIKGKLPDHVELHSLRLYETSTSYAEWYASDNL